MALEGGWWDVLAVVGAMCFGLVVGWVTYRTLRRREGVAALSDIATVLGSVGGAAVTALFGSPALFGAYAVGLAGGFFLYFAVGLRLEGDRVRKWMGD
jgi:ABC-type sulfate transport system permease component